MRNCVDLLGLMFGKKSQTKFGLKASQCVPLWFSGLAACTDVTAKKSRCGQRCLGLLLEVLGRLCFFAFLHFLEQLKVFDCGPLLLPLKPIMTSQGLLIS